MKCLKCNGNFIPKRSTAKFCSPKCRLAYHRDPKPGTDVTITPRKPKQPDSVTKAVDSLTSEKMAKVIMSLIKDRRSIVGKGTTPYSTFHIMGKSDGKGNFPGSITIQLGMNDIIIGDVKYKLGKPKKK